MGGFKDNIMSASISLNFRKTKAIENFPLLTVFLLKGGNPSLVGRKAKQG